MLSLLFSKAEYQKRRQLLAAHLEPQKDLVVYFSGSIKLRNNDNAYRFRPDSSFYYLTGYAEPESALMIWREKEGAKLTTKWHLFVMPRDPEREQWDGYRYGTDGAKKLTGANYTSDIAKLREEILKWFEKVPKSGVAPRVYSNVRVVTDARDFLERTLDMYRPKSRLGQKQIAYVGDATAFVEEQRLVKSPAELKVMQEAADINVGAHLKIMEQIKPGMFEYEIEAILLNEYLKNGCQDLAYGSICGSGDNATILHYHENNRRMKDHELFLVDAGCEHKYFASDITRTMPVNGMYNKEQRIIMDIVMEAHTAATDCCRVGVPVTKFHQVATEVLVDGLKGLGFLKGKKKDIIEKLEHKRYYPHGTGHWLGHDVHDANPYTDDKGNPIRFEAGMVTTIEPGLYFLPHDKTVPSEYRGIGVRIEDDVVVTKGAPKTLTRDLPRSADEVEKYMAKKRR